jgi:XRE family transcriptional regulator, master regulator for biofilm formation
MTSRELADRVQELRRSRGLSVSQLAERAQIAQSYVVLIEAGQQRLPPRAILVRLARGLGVPEKELVEPIR